MTSVSETSGLVPQAGEKPKIARGGLWRRLVSGGIWVVGSRFCGITSNVFTNVVLARQLAPESFGDFVVITSIVNAASLIAIFGMNSGVVRFVAEQLAHEDPIAARVVLKNCFRVSALAAFATTIVVFIGVSISGSYFLALKRPVLIAALTVCAVAFQAFGNLNAASLRSLGEMRYSSIVGGQVGAGPMSNTIFFLLLAVVACFVRLTFYMALSAYVISFAIAVAISTGWLLKTMSVVLGSRETKAPLSSSTPIFARAILAACLPMLLVQILSNVLKQSGLWVAGATCSPQDLALFAGANKAIQLVAMPLGLINLSVMAFIPQLRVQGRLQELERIMRVSAGWAAIPSFIALLAFVVAPEQILSAFLGPTYRDAARLLTILSFGQFALVWVGSAELTLVLSGHARSAAVTNAVAACSILAIGPLFSNYYGVTGVAIVSAIAVLGQSLALWALTRKHVHIWTHASLFPWRMLKEIR